MKQSVAAEKKYYPKERGFKTADTEKLLLAGDIQGGNNEGD